MTAATWPRGVDRVILEEIDSTSVEAMRRAPTGPTWILARQQTAGKGRRGRTWAMPRGNFAASLVWRPVGTPADLALRSFTASLALHDTLHTFGVDELSLKWPNDVLLGDRKLAGILLESPLPGLLILGIGVNLIAAPDPAEIETGALPPTSLLEATGLHIDPIPFLDVLACAVAEREAELTSFGFAPIRATWMRHAARIGQPITARLPDEEIHGIFGDVDDAGHLILETATGPRRITAGDVFFGQTSGQGV